MIQGLGWCYLVIVLDWFTKKIVGYSISMRCKTREWLEAIHMAIEKECGWGAREEELSLISDNGSQPTSLSFMKEMQTLGIKQIFFARGESASGRTSYDNPKGNADTERAIRTIKEELLWLEEFENLDEAKEKIANWIEWYNGQYLHSSLGYMSPEEFLRKWEEETRKEEQALLCFA
jgi:transposase InsO family protein